MQPFGSDPPSEAEAEALHQKIATLEPFDFLSLLAPPSVPFCHQQQGVHELHPSAADVICAFYEYAAQLRTHRDTFPNTPPPQWPLIFPGRLFGF